MHPHMLLAQTATGAVLPQGHAITVTDLVTLVENIFTYLGEIAVVIVVGMMVWGGLMMATSGSDEAKFKKGKATLWNAIIGAVVIFGVGLIVNTVANFASSPSNVF